MAHYDCSNCGAYTGIDFGYCRECTPAEYRKLDQRAQEITRDLDKSSKELAEPFRLAIRDLLAVPHQRELAEIKARLSALRLEHTGRP